MTVNFFWPETLRPNLTFLINYALPRLNDGDVRYWLNDGSLLGCYRDHDIILGDNDADILVVKDDFDRACALLEADPPLGVTLQRRVSPENGDLRRKTARLLFNRARLDIVGARDHDGRVQYSDSGKAFDFARDTIFPVQRVPFLQTQAATPADTPSVLRAVYGDDYMTPRPGFKGPHLSRYPLWWIPPTLLRHALPMLRTYPRCSIAGIVAMTMLLVRQLRHYLGPFLMYFSALCRPTTRRVMLST